MKSRDTLIRLKRFQLEEKRRRVGQIEMTDAEIRLLTTVGADTFSNRRPVARHTASNVARGLADTEASRTSGVSVAAAVTSVRCERWGPVEAARVDRRHCRN